MYKRLSVNSLFFYCFENLKYLGLLNGLYVYLLICANTSGRVGARDLGGFGGWNLSFLSRIDWLFVLTLNRQDTTEGDHDWGLTVANEVPGGSPLFWLLSGLNCVVCKHGPLGFVRTCLYMHLTSVKCTRDYTCVVIISPIIYCETCSTHTYLINSIHKERHSSKWQKMYQ